ncbi:MAG: GNAT family N-acetyltransferase [Acidobacteria bacterium]|nr:GNAT family N-acetyltransferase [Acidobacteriota bacterium]
MTAYRSAEPLSPSHEFGGFESGKPELDDWLRRHAFASHQAGSARVYVLSRENRVVGYYALAAASVEPADAPARVKKGLGRRAIPVILLARLAVDRREQGKGLGAVLLGDALRRAASAAGEIGARAVLVHAKDADARAFYEHFDFEPSPTDPLHLLLLMKDLRALLARNRR